MSLLVWIAIGSVLLIAGGIYGLSAILGLSERAAKNADHYLNQELRPGPCAITLLSGETLSGELLEADERTVVLRETGGNVVLRRDSIAYVRRGSSGGQSARNNW